MLDQAAVDHRGSVPTSAPREHLVHFYEEPADLVERVAGFAAEGLAAGDAVVLVATARHVASIRDLLGDAARDVRVLDASETLATFCRDGVIDREAFMQIAGEVVRDASAGGRHVRVFGEMVAMLWDLGHVPAAVELEALWESLAGEQSLTVLCAYPAEVLLDLRSNEPVIDVCRMHSRGELGVGPGTGSFLHAFPSVLAAVGEARRFVTACLRHTDTDVLYDARLIASELASNAVQHAHTPFLVEVSHHDGAIRIAVRDGDPGMPELKAITLEGDAGRGMALVEKLSSRWGVEGHALGKTVWAELSQFPE